MSEPKDVKEKSDASADERDEVELDSDKDEKGVPYRNRYKELERKTNEKIKSLEDQFEAIRQSMSEAEEEDASDENDNDVKKQLSNLATDPEKYISERVEKRMLQFEANRAVEWLESQEGFDGESKKRILELTKEPMFKYLTPMLMAKKSWEYHQKEMELEELRKLKQDKNKSKDLAKAFIEGSGRPADVKSLQDEYEKVKKELAIASRNQENKEEERLIGRMSELKKQMGK